MKILDTYLDPVVQVLVGSGQLLICLVSIVKLEFQFTDLNVVLLLKTAQFCLVFGLNLHNGTLQLLNGTLATLAIITKLNVK